MDRFVKYRACKSLPMQFAKVGEHKDLLGAIGPKMRFGHNFRLEGPIDLKPMRLNVTLDGWP